MTSSDPQRASVVLLSGFLGAGKTTLLKRMLAWETDLSDTVVLVNEFGKVGIDGALLQNAGTDVIELTSGCICCTLSAGLKQSLESIQRRFEPRRILIEATGVADPTAVQAVLREAPLAGKMALKKTITVLDAEYWEARENFGPLFYNQLDAANLILLNKIDLVEADRVPLYLREIHALIPDTQVVPTLRCGVDPGTLWTDAAPRSFGLQPIQFYRPAGGSAGPSAGAAANPVDASRYVAFSYGGEAVLDESRFRLFIAKLPWEVFRMKGPVTFADRTEVINFVGGKADWVSWDGPPHTRLAFVGWDVDPEKVLGDLERCRA